MTIEDLLRDYAGEHPDAYVAGYSDAGRMGIRGEATGFPDNQRDAYAAGVVKASQDRSQAFPAPWAGAVEDDDNGSSVDSAGSGVADDGATIR